MTKVSAKNSEKLVDSGIVHLDVDRRELMAELFQAIPSCSREQNLQTAEKKVSWRVLPIVMMIVVLYNLDRANISFGSVYMDTELGFSASVYGLGSGVFFLAYVGLQLPSTLCATHFGARRWLPVLAASWGIVACCTAFIRNQATFVAMRLLLGATEAGVIPTIWFQLGLLYPKDRLTLPMTVSLVGGCVSNVLGAPLAAAILQMHGLAGLSGWQWLFLIEGIPALVLAGLIWLYLPSSVPEAGFLTQPEKEALQQALDAADSPDTRIRWVEGFGLARRTLARKEFWYCTSVGFLYACSMFALLFWTPLLVQGVLGGPDAGAAKGGTGSNNSAQLAVLLAIIPSAVAGLVQLGTSWHSQKVMEKRYHTAVPWAFAAAGLLLLPLARSHSAPAGLAVLVVAAGGMYGADGVWVTWVGLVFTGDLRPVALTLFNMLSCVGGFLGPYLVGVLKDATGSYDASSYLMGSAALATVVLVLCMPGGWEGRDGRQKQDERQEAQEEQQQEDCIVVEISRHLEDPKFRDCNA